MKTLMVTVMVTLLTACTETRSHEDAKRQVALDAVRSYEMAARSGAAIDRCAAAQYAAMAWMQAGDEAQFARYKAIEHADCRAAGAE